MCQNKHHFHFYKYPFIINYSVHILKRSMQMQPMILTKRPYRVPQSMWSKDNIGMVVERLESKRCSKL